MLNLLVTLLPACAKAPDATSLQVTQIHQPLTVIHSNIGTVCGVIASTLDVFTPETKTEYHALLCDKDRRPSLHEVAVYKNHKAIRPMTIEGPDCLDEHSFFIQSALKTDLKGLLIATVDSAHEAQAENGYTLDYFSLGRNADKTPGMTDPQFKYESSIKLIGKLCSKQDIEDSAIRSITRITSLIDESREVP